MKAFVKNIYRFIKYKQQREKVFREFKIKPVQNKILVQNFSCNTSKLIIFFVPGADRKTGKETMSGGVISIVSICEETEKLFKNDATTATILCTLNGDNLFLKYNNFENNTSLFRFEQIANYFKNLTKIIIHIPDYLVPTFYKNLTKKDAHFLKQIQFVHINIMNQNIILMPQPNEIDPLKALSNLTTITTAHQQYCTAYYREYYKVPLHKLSVWISPEQYNFVAKDYKENLLVYSPDSKPQKEKIINRLKEIKGLKIQQIQGLSYTEFKELISRAKWALTFGEGLDGYFLEPIFSGAISFAVYNEDFFTERFKTLKTVYKSHEDLYNNIVNDIEFLDRNEESFVEHQKQQFEICADLYSSKVYRDNIVRFYNNEFTFN